MPTPGTITDRTRRCLENIAVAGPSTAAELNALDPTAPDHKQTLKAAAASHYVSTDGTTVRSGPGRYQLTNKARDLLAGIAITAEPSHAVSTPKPAAKARSYAAPQGVNVTPARTHGGGCTQRMEHPCADMLAPATRAGAERALKIPSRVNDMLHYRDGRCVHIDAMADSL